MGVAATLAPKGLGPQDPTKKLAHRVELLGQPLSQKKVFENLGPEPPLNQWGRYFKRAWDRKHSYNMLKVKICNEIDTEESCVTSCRC